MFFWRGKFGFFFVLVDGLLVIRLYFIVKFFIKCGGFDLFFYKGYSFCIGVGFYVVDVGMLDV